MRFLCLLALPALGQPGATEMRGIRAAYEQHRHTAVRDADGWKARNPRQQFVTRFDGRGFTVQPDTGAWRWGLELRAYGFSGAMREAARNASVSVRHERVGYDWGSGIEEWFVNDRRGLEHGFTLRERPEQGAGPLRLRMAVRGELEAREMAAGIDFGPVQYAGLKA